MKNEIRVIKWGVDMSEYLADEIMLIVENDLKPGELLTLRPAGTSMPEDWSIVDILGTLQITEE